MAPFHRGTAARLTSHGSVFHRQAQKMPFAPDTSVALPPFMLKVTHWEDRYMAILPVRQSGLSKNKCLDLTAQSLGVQIHSRPKCGVL